MFIQLFSSGCFGQPKMLLENRDPPFLDKLVIFDEIPAWEDSARKGYPSDKLSLSAF
jgi:hypothetical protein